METEKYAIYKYL